MKTATKMDLKFLRATVIVAIIVCLCSVRAQRTAQCCEEYCYELDSDRLQSAHFSTKTAYQIAKGSETGRQYLVPNCSPVKIWILSRHGTRLPSGNSMKDLRALEDLRNEVVENYEKRRTKPSIGALCEGDLDLLKYWRWDQNLTDQYSEHLTVQGWDDLKFLAIRYQRVFPSILENIYDASKFKFQFTNTQRTEASYRAFVEGLFGENAYKHIQVPPPVDGNDTLLRPYEACPAWVKQEETIKEKNSEYAKFESTPIFTQVVSDVSSRLGFRYPLKIDQIDDIFDMCRYDLAWKLDVPSPWCAAFTPNQISVLEYREDLKYYYKSGYGSELNPKVECAAVADMLRSLDSDELPKVTAYFSHSSAVQLFLTALGANRDREALRADNYLDMRQRRWKTSELGPFTSNIAAIKYDCPNESERRKIMFFLNEKPMDFDWCHVGLCNWSEVKEKYKDFLNGDCQKTFCGNGGQLAVISSLTLLLPILAIICLRLFRA